MRETLSKLLRITGKDEKGAEEIEELRDEVHQLPMEKIIPNRYQPRTIFNNDRIEELAETIRIHGVIQPIVVRWFDEENYEIIAGERRFRAVQKLGWETIPAIIRDMNDAETASVALIENLQREELTSIEEAWAYEKLLELHQLTQEALAQRLGKSQSTIANKLRLLKLPELVQSALLEKRILERHARAVLQLKEEELQLNVLNSIIDKQLSVQQTEQLIANILEEKPKKQKVRQKSFGRDTRLAINTIRESLHLVQKTGMAIDSKEEEHEEFYKITITIPKKPKP